ncbi:MAG: hypothetical protein JKY94_16625, partial [Rhodobacteraceae bacterium]|nr:hypothetical protein [Paracoccaceae bacterium]
MNIGNWIDAFRPAKGPPPETLRAFMGWCLSGAWPALWLAVAVSAAAGALEAGTAFILGIIVDATVNSGPEQIFSVSNIGLLAIGVGFFLVARPVLFGLTASANAIIVQPNLNPLVLSRLHRWTLGQSVSFFDNDFAGRIAQKQMQTARAVTEVAAEVINVVAFALASLVGSLALLTVIDPRISAIFLVWLIGYFALIRWFMPRIRIHAAARAGARAMVTGQVVDTITNIKTVKLFAHADHEDRAALGAMQGFRQSALDFGYMAAGFRFCLMSLAGLLPVLLIGATLILFSQGQASEGHVVAAGAIAIRIAQMTGWVSFTLMAIYANVGNEQRLYTKLGARVKEVGGIPGVAFAVWAPSAKRVSVVGNFNYWDGRYHPMRSLGESGVWEIFVPGLKQGELYKFEILTASSSILLKTDPLGNYFEPAPNNAAIVFNDGDYEWKDSEWLGARNHKKSIDEPLSVYELHLGSWKRVVEDNDRPLTYREVAPLLADYVMEMG